MNTPELPVPNPVATKHRLGIERLAQLPRILFSKLSRALHPSTTHPSLDTTQPEEIKQDVSKVRVRKQIVFPQPILKDVRKPREQRMAEYQGWKAGQRQQEPTGRKRREESYPTRQITVGKLAQPEQYRPNIMLEIIPGREISWIDQPEQITLSLKRCSGGNKVFYYADFIRSSRLIAVKEKLEKSKIMPDLDDLLFKRLEAWFQNPATVYVRPLDKPN